MAWIRTALAFISFGFGIGKVQDYMEKIDPDRVYDPIHGARIFGGAFITLGILAVLVAVIQYRRRLSLIKQDVFVYSVPLPLSAVVALLLLLIGLFGFVHLFL